ncbi:MAG: hypothetical protein HYW50_04445 [Candidatus Diapherotrites archaeon]|nr:hypothetical protein [Candidatus Diapherotrites archaeon]
MRGKARESILRVLLNNPNEGLSKYRVAKLAGCSFPWALEVLNELQKKKLVKNTKVLNYKKLIEYWRKIHKKPTFWQYSVRDPFELLKKTSLDYALTTYAAENLVQKYLFLHRVDVYINENDFKKWHKLLTKEGLVGGGNLRLIKETDKVFYKSFEVKGLKVVSLPQLIVDLFVEGAMCVEAMLLKEWEKHVR